jgi:DNA-binding response OmpR family regulator
MDSNHVLVLHVEDDPIQHAVIVRHLSCVEGYSFDVLRAETEEAAMHVFMTRQWDMVILDYALSDGNGLSCLRRLRELDEMIPIIALSGTATAEIAAELIEAGADDYLHKETVDKRVLEQSVRNVLIRSCAIRKRRAAAVPTAN